MMRPQTITQPSRTGGGTDVILVSPKGDVLRTIARGIPYKKAIEIVRGSARAHSHMKPRKRIVRRRRGHSRWDDFDLETEIEEGYGITDARGGGYNVRRPNGGSLGHFKSRGGAFRAIIKDMEKSNFYPNVFYVNERGNTDLFAIRIADNGKVMRRLVKSWV
jgi:hypothetical protein